MAALSPSLPIAWQREQLLRTSTSLINESFIGGSSLGWSKNQKPNSC